MDRDNFARFKRSDLFKQLLLEIDPNQVCSGVGIVSAAPLYHPGISNGPVGTRRRQSMRWMRTPLGGCPWFAWYAPTFSCVRYPGLP